MAVTIKLKNASGSNPSASDLVVGEVAIRTDNGKLFTKKDNGTVAEISGGGGGIDDGDKGDITVSNSGDTFTIDDGVITSAKIADGAIVNADINASAAIAGTKISPDFGSQNITTTGIVKIADGSVSAPALAFTDDLDTGIFSVSGNTINFTTAGVERLEMGTSLTVFNDGGEDVDFRIEGNTNANLFKVDAGNDRIGIGTASPASTLDVAGNITVSGTIDASGKVDCQAGLETDGDVILNSTTTNVNVTFDASDAALEFTDNAKLTLGSSADLTLFHNGNHSKIRDTGTGNLYIESVDGNIYLRVNDNEMGVAIIENGATELYHNNSQKFTTSSSGGTLTGTLVADGFTGPLTGDVTGNADTATTLANARTIAGVSFDGSANISLNNNAITNGAGYITATLTEEQVEDFVGGMVTGNTETGITVTYQDSDGTLDFVVASQTDENFTTTLKNKLDGIAASATNVTNTNQLTNGAGFITSTLSNEQVQDIVGGMVSGNSESGISVTYQDSDGTLDFSVSSQTDENFTTTLKNKLDGIASGATNVTNNNQLTNGAGYVTSNTQLSNEQVQDIVGGMVSGNSESGITVTYQDSDGTLDFSVSSSGISEDTGSWTPTVTFGGGSSGQSYNIRVGRYVKLGSLVHIQCHVEFSDKGNSSGTAKIAGLPFTIRNGTNDFPSAVMAFKDHGSSSSGPGSISSFMVFGDPNNTTLDIAREQLNDSTSEMNDATNGNFADNTQFMLTMTYVAA